MSVFCISSLAPRPYVYAMVCQDGDGPVYIKFGRSSNIGSRLGQLQTACPIPSKYFCVIEVAGDGIAKTVEKMLHKQFSARKVKGEWFRFDDLGPNEKAEFSGGCKYVFRLYIPGWKQTWWTIIDAQLLLESRRITAKKFLASPYGKARLAREKRERSFRRRMGIIL